MFPKPLVTNKLHGSWNRFEICRCVRYKTYGSISTVLRLIMLVFCVHNNCYFVRTTRGPFHWDSEVFSAIPFQNLLARDLTSLVSATESIQIIYHYPECYIMKLQTFWPFLFILEFYNVCHVFINSRLVSIVPSQSFIFFSVFVGIFSCSVRLSFGVNTCLPIQTLVCRY